MDRRLSRPRPMSTYHLGVVPRQPIYHPTIWCPGCQSLSTGFPSSGFALTSRQGNVYFVHWTSTKRSSVMITIMSSPTSSFLRGGGSTHYTHVFDYDILSRRNRRTSIAPYVYAIIMSNSDHSTLAIWDSTGRQSRRSSVGPASIDFDDVD